MDDAIKRNGKGVWLREIVKVLKRFVVSLEWLIDRSALRDEEMVTIKRNDEID